MKIALIAAAAALLTASGSYAESHNPAVKNAHVVTTKMAAKGRNSFTEAQARGRIAKAGYGHIGKLTKNRNGVWQGRATRNGRPVTVALDYKGNVTLH